MKRLITVIMALALAVGLAVTGHAEDAPAVNYRSRKAEVHAAAETLRSLGFDDSSEAIRALQAEWWRCDREQKAAKEPELVYVGTFKTTGYCPGRCCNGRWAYQTATGAAMAPGRTVAVDPSVIAYGTRLIIDGHEYIAEDTGVCGYHIDVLYPTHEEARAHGVQWKEVWREA